MQNLKGSPWSSLEMHCHGGAGEVFLKMRVSAIEGLPGKLGVAIMCVVSGDVDTGTVTRANSHF